MLRLGFVVKTCTRTPRIATVDGCEARAHSPTKLQARDDVGLEGKLSGWASVVSIPYDMGAYDESSLRVFTKTLAGGPDVQLLINHECLPLARTTIPPRQPGHLSLTED